MFPPFCDYLSLSYFLSLIFCFVVAQHNSAGTKPLCAVSFSHGVHWSNVSDCVIVIGRRSWSRAAPGLAGRTPFVASSDTFQRRLPVALGDGATIYGAVIMKAAPGARHTHCTRQPPIGLWISDGAGFRPSVNREPVAEAGRVAMGTAWYTQLSRLGNKRLIAAAIDPPSSLGVPGGSCCF